MRARSETLHSPASRNTGSELRSRRGHPLQCYPASLWPFLEVSAQTRKSRLLLPVARMTKKVTCRGFSPCFVGASLSCAGSPSSSPGLPGHLGREILASLLRFGVGLQESCRGSRAALQGASALWLLASSLGAVLGDEACRWSRTSRDVFGLLGSRCYLSLGDC